MTTKPSKELETFPTPAPHRDFHIRMDISEFICIELDSSDSQPNTRG